MWSLENLAAAVLLLGLIMYATFGGADFGGGIWSGLASGPRRRQQREELFHAIGPVWETNHVWLIFVIVVMLMVFPAAFSALFIALLIPLVLVLVGINFRGAAFAFRHFGHQTGRRAPLIARSFEFASVITPFFMGMTVTATGAGTIRLQATEVVPDLWGWITPFTLMGGVIGVVVCAYLTPIYMAARTKRELQEDFRRRGLAAALALGVLTALAIPVAFVSAPLFAARLLEGPTLAVIALAVASGTTTAALLWKRRVLSSQIGAAVTVAFTLIGYGVALHPDLLIGQLSVAEAAAPLATLRVFFAVLPVGVIILAPSLFFLYWTFRGRPDPEQPPE